MGSKSKTVDATTTSTSTQVLDRKAVQQRGQQILDSLIVANDDKVVNAAMGEVRVMLDNMGHQNAITVDKMLGLSDRLMQFVSRGQVDITRFGMDALERARADLRLISDQGQAVITLADETVGKAMTMAERVSSDQADNNRRALEIVAGSKGGDYMDTLQSVSGMIMIFALAALLIVRGK